MAFLASAFTGSADLGRKLAALGESVRQEALQDAVAFAAEPMRVRMGQLAPRGPDAPHLADSMVVAKVRKIDGIVLGPQEAAVGIGPTKDFFYGFFWEFGWVNHPSPHPFVRPAYEEERDTALEAIGRRLWAAINGTQGPSGFGGGTL